MPLDSNLFTLYLVPRSNQPSLSDLFSRLPSKSSTDHQPIPNYTTSRWIRHATYQTSLLDGVTGDDLGSISAPSSNHKTKTIHLHNPDATVELQDRRLGATISLPLWKHEWQFEWQGERFQITRESTSGRASSFDVEIIRKPDPPIKVAMYRPEGSSAAASLQMMDYNIDRIESITDKRGLEYVLVLAITSCLDAQYDEKYKDPQENIFMNPVAAYHTDGAPNEVNVLAQFHPNQVVEHCLQLFKVNDTKETEAPDSSTSRLRSAVKNHGCDLVVLKADGQEMQQRALSIAERTKVGFYRLDQKNKGTADELYQYVTMAGQASQESETKTDATSMPSQQNGQKPSQTSSSRPRIKLGSSHSSGTSSPISSTHAPAASSAVHSASSMTIYLSKHRLEELEAEQAAKARARLDEQSRLLAERLANEGEDYARPSRPLSSPDAAGPATSRPLRQRMGFWKG